MSEAPTRMMLSNKFIDTEVKDGKLQYIFDKNHHAKLLLHNLILMQESEDLCDVTIISEDEEEFHFHGPILTALNDTQQAVPAKSQEPFSSDAIQCLWDYAYQSDVTLSAANINDVKDLAARYGLDDLRKACEELEEDIEEEGDDVVMSFEGLPAKLLNGLNNLLQQQRLCSMIIKGSNSLVGIPCHSAVLAAASSEFHEQLTQGNKRELQVTDATFQVMTPLVQYIYTAKISIVGDTVLPLLETALDYSIPSIVQVCCSWIQDAVTTDNVLGMMNKAKSMVAEAKDKGGHPQSSIEFLENLFRSSRKFVLENFLKIKDEDEFLEMTYDDLIDLISDDELVLDSEEDLCHAVMKWVEYNQEIQELPNLLKAIRLEHTSLDFLDSLLDHDLIKGNTACIDIINEVLPDTQDYQQQSLYDFDQVQQYLKEQELYRFDQETSFEPPDLELVPPTIFNEEPSADQLLPNLESVNKKRTPKDMRLRRNREAFLERGKKLDGTPDRRFKENKEAHGEVARKLFNEDEVPRRKDGKPDMRFKVNKKPHKEIKVKSRADIPRRKDGKPDMRFKVNKIPKKEISFASSTSKVDANGPLKKNGTPDMRFAVNKPHAGKTSDKKTSSLSLKNNGTPDMRYAVNKQESSSGSPSINAHASGPVKKDGTPDMRYAVNKQRTKRTTKSSESLSSASSNASGPVKKDGTPDMRYSSNKSSSGSSYSSTGGSTSGHHGGPSASLTSSASGPVKKDGTPDMRYRSNKTASGSSSSYGGSSYSSPSYGGSSSSSSSGYPGRSSSSSTPSGPLKSDGTPDMRYSSNKSAYGTGSSYSSYGGSSYSSPSYGGTSSSSSRGYSGGSSSSYTPSGPCKSDGTPDMRYSANRR